MSKINELYPAELSDLPIKKCERAMYKLVVLLKYYRRLYALAVSGKVKRSLLQREAFKGCGVSRGTLQRWEHRLRVNGLRGLVDMRGGGH